MKCLVSGGCSFAYGANMEDRNKRYAKCIADFYGAELIDTSAAGASNETIASAISYGVNKALKCYKPEDIVVIAAWTETQRVEFWSKDTARIVSAFPVIASHRDAGAYVLKVSQFVGENMWEPCYGYYKLLHAFNYVESVCTSNNIRLLHKPSMTIRGCRGPNIELINTDMRNSDYFEDSLSPSVLKRFDRYVFGSKSFLKWLYKNPSFFVNPGSDHHPNDKGHQEWAARMISMHGDLLNG